MSITLGHNQYGKAETRLVRVHRDGEVCDLVDLNVSISLAGQFADTHLSGDNANVLPTDTQKNTVYAFARSYGIDQIEEFGLRLARHFVDTHPAVSRARVSIEEYPWRRLGQHSFVRGGEGVRTTTASYGSVAGLDEPAAWVVSGIGGLMMLNATHSEFHGFARDHYTTLAETSDRILATVVDASWRHAGAGSDWAASYAGARDALVGAFVSTHSLSLQQTLFTMGRAVIEAQPEVVEVRLSLPNRHHYIVDLEPFGLDNPDEVYLAADRPYGLIEGTVLREDAPPPGLAWSLSA